MSKNLVFSEEPLFVRSSCDADTVAQLLEDEQRAVEYIVAEWKSHQLVKSIQRTHQERKAKRKREDQEEKKNKNKKKLMRMKYAESTSDVDSEDMNTSSNAHRSDWKEESTRKANNSSSGRRQSRKVAILQKTRATFPITCYAGYLREISVGDLNPAVESVPEEYQERVVAKVANCFREFNQLTPELGYEVPKPFSLIRLELHEREGLIVRTYFSASEVGTRKQSIREYLKALKTLRGI